MATYMISCREIHVKANRSEVRGQHPYQLIDDVKKSSGTIKLVNYKTAPNKHTASQMQLK